MFCQCQILSSVHATTNWRCQKYPPKSGPGTATATAQRDGHSTKPSIDLWAHHRTRQYITYRIRPLIRAQQSHARPIKKPARPDFGPGAWHVGWNFTSLLQTQVWKGKVDKKACQSKCIDERSTMRRSTWLYLSSVRSYWQKMTWPSVRSPLRWRRSLKLRCA